MISPEAIPKMVDVSVSKNQYILCYFLAACEFGIAYLSFQTTKIREAKAIRIILFSFIIFHLATAVLEVFVLQNGVSKALILNIILRIVVSLLFYLLGLYKLNKKITLETV